MGAGIKGGYMAQVGGMRDFPIYMKNVHNEWLNAAATHFLSTSETILMNTAFGNSPFTGKSSADMTDSVSNISEAIDITQVISTMLALGTPLDYITTMIINGSNTELVLEAYSTELENSYLANEFQEFNAHMRRIGAINSSAYSIGKAVIESDMIREIATEEARLYNDLVNNQLVLALMKLSAQSTLSYNTIETNRIKFIALDEQNEHNIAIDDSITRWNFEVMLYGGNILGGNLSGQFVSKKYWKNLMPAPAKVLQDTVTGWLYGGMIGAIVYMVIGAYRSFTDESYLEG